MFCCSNRNKTRTALHGSGKLGLQGGSVAADAAGSHLSRPGDTEHRTWCQALASAPHFLQLGPTSKRFHNLPGQHHQRGLKCPNIISLWRTFYHIHTLMEQERVHIHNPPFPFLGPVHIKSIPRRGDPPSSTLTPLHGTLLTHCRPRACLRIRFVDS